MFRVILVFVVFVLFVPSTSFGLDIQPQVTPASSSRLVANSDIVNFLPIAQFRSMEDVRRALDKEAKQKKAATFEKMFMYIGGGLVIVLLAIIAIGVVRKKK